MTQAEFAEAFQLPLSTLRDWEQHRSIPDAPDAYSVTASGGVAGLSSDATA
jgi:putative transcriptional regulator